MTEVQLLEDPTTRERHPSVLEQWCVFFYLPFEFIDKGKTEGEKANCLMPSVPFVVCVGFRILASSLFWLFFFNIINEAKVNPVTERKEITH